ncbi:MAG: NADH-quinone oxidoreductase subunit L [Sphingomonadales bacterium]|nr:NADH-quinone oxidoreductase subunit L [Sphingomonadales bacterium]
MQDIFQLAYWIPLLPLLGSLLNGLGRRYMSRSMAGWIGSLSVLGSFVLSVLVFLHVKSGHSEVIHYFDFIKVGTLTIPFSFQLDALSSLFLLIITGVGFLIHVYSTAYMHEEDPDQFARYFSYLNLFVFSMLLLVLGSNYVILFIGWEGVGLCSYLLIGYWFKNPAYTAAANKAFIMNRIGDLAFLVALFWIITKSGVVGFQDFFSFVQQHQFTERFTATDITVITLLFFIGATGKSAQLPLYTWLPDAMAGPTPVSALIHAATMVTAGIYLIARSNFLYSLAPHTLHLISWVGLLTALLAASIALAQNDIKKVLAYSTVSQLGFMFLALGTGAYAAAVFHVMTHAFFKALLFLGSGSVIHAMGGEQDIRKMGGLSTKLRITYFTFLIGCIAIAGIPPFSGFFSKDAILLSVFLHSPLQYGLALFAALLTAFYMFRLLFLTFAGQFRGTEEQKHHLHESPWAMTLPLLVLAVLSVIGGWVGIPEVLLPNAEPLIQFLSPVIPVVPHAVSHETEYILMATSTVLVLLMVLAAWWRYRHYQPGVSTSPFTRLLENKWYVDEIYDKLIVQPLSWMAAWLRSVAEAKVIDGFVNGVGRAVQYSARQLRFVQSGQVGLYVLLMVLSMAVMLFIQFFIRK